VNGMGAPPATETSRLDEKASVPVHVIFLRKYVFTVILVVKTWPVAAGVTGFQATLSNENSQAYVRPVPKLAPETDRLKLPPAQTAAGGPTVVPPFNDPGTHGVGGSQVNVKPDAGIIVLEEVQASVLADPCVVVFQLVVVDLL
jgi:hypothetical protein